MKRYDSGIKDLSLEIIQNYDINEIELFKNQENISFIKRIIEPIKRKLFPSKIKKDNTTSNINAFIIKKINKQYYNDDYLDLLNCDEETNDEKKFRETIQKQNNKILNENFKPLNKDQTMRQLVYELDVLIDAYNLPELSITNKEWDILFNKTYNFFINHGVEAKFYEYMNSVIRLTLAKILVDNTIEIGKNEFIEGLDYLKVCKEFNSKDIDELQKELNVILRNNKITNINEYKRRLLKN